MNSTSMQWQWSGADVCSYFLSTVTEFFLSVSIYVYTLKWHFLRYRDILSLLLTTLTWIWEQNDPPQLGSVSNSFLPVPDLRGQGNIMSALSSPPSTPLTLPHPVILFFVKILPFQNTFAEAAATYSSERRGFICVSAEKENMTLTWGNWTLESYIYCAFTKQM